MSSLRKVAANTAGEIAQHIELNPEAEELLVEQEKPEAYLRTLIDKELFDDAITFLAHALPKREAVWWACLTTRNTLDQAAQENFKNALQAAENWVFKPTEAHRRAAEHWALKTDFQHPASWAAMAAFWSMGSVTKPDEPAVPPGPYLYAHAVSGAVILSATLQDPDNSESHFKQFLVQGIDIANGGRGEIETTH